MHSLTGVIRFIQMKQHLKFTFHYFLRSPVTSLFSHLSMISQPFSKWDWTKQRVGHAHSPHLPSQSGFTALHKPIIWLCCRLVISFHLLTCTTTPWVPKGNWLWRCWAESQRHPPDWWGMDAACSDDDDDDDASVRTLCCGLFLICWGCFRRRSTRLCQ